MADELLQATPVAGSADHNVGGRPISAYEDRSLALKPLDLADDARPTVLQGAHETVVNRGINPARRKRVMKPSGARGIPYADRLP